MTPITDLLCWLISVPTTRTRTQNSDGSIAIETNRYWTNWLLIKLYLLGVCTGAGCILALFHFAGMR